MDKIEEIINDMELALEGVPFSENNKNIIRGLAILEHKNPSFKYSKDNLPLYEKVMEIRNYYINKGYLNNYEILDELNINKIGVLR